MLERDCERSCPWHSYRKGAVWCIEADAEAERVISCRMHPNPDRNIRLKGQAKLIQDRRRLVGYGPSYVPMPVERVAPVVREPIVPTPVVRPEAPISPATRPSVEVRLSHLTIKPRSKNGRTVQTRFMM